MRRGGGERNKARLEVHSIQFFTFELAKIMVTVTVEFQYAA